MEQRECGERQEIVFIIETLETIPGYSMPVPSSRCAVTFVYSAIK